MRLAFFLAALPFVSLLGFAQSLTSSNGVDITKIGGVAISTGNGVSGSGVQRVTIASDSTGQVALAAGSATIGALTANQSVNVSQINGVTPLMGAGNTGTGSPRVTIASDQVAIPILGSLGDNSAANTTNRAATLPAIAESNMPSAATAGRNVALRTDLQGTLLASLLPSGFATFAAAKTGLVPASSATDIAVLSGNATNTVIVTEITMGCTQTTAGLFDVQLLMRTTADSGGTSTNSPTARPLDTNNSSAVSAVLTYTANPTVNDGTTRIIDTQKIFIPATTSAANDLFFWRPTMGQAIVLRGTAQQAAINFNGVTLTGGNCDIRYTWIETTGL